ncbi:hypothetical protein F4810DRAFT_453324 [Camillea tinctor]|nr:hypothetical protein F4810DRAFT_453324 [Camillea tinctor]
MALNSGRGNPIAAVEGPDKTGEGAPPPVPSEVKSTLNEAAGLHAGGEDVGVAASRAEKADPKVEGPPRERLGADEQGGGGGGKV